MSISNFLTERYQILRQKDMQALLLFMQQAIDEPKALVDPVVQDFEIQISVFCMLVPFIVTIRMLETLVPF